MTEENDEPSAARPPVATFRFEPGTRAVVHVAGELDAESGSELRSLLSAAFENGPEAVVVDVTDMTFVDSVGLSVLVAAHNRGVDDGVPLRVDNLQPSCRRVFELTGLHEVLDLG